MTHAHTAVLGRMSLFGTTNTTSTGPTQPKTAPFNFATAPFQLSTFSTQATAPAVSSAVSAATSAAATGLGGQIQTTASSTLNGSFIQTQTAITKPKDSQVPPELSTLVDGLRGQIKTNKDLCDQIATTSMKHVRAVGAQVKQLNEALAATHSCMQHTAQRAQTLRDDSRADLRQVEMVQRRHEALPAHQYAVDDLNQPLNYLHSLATQYEQQLITYAQHLNTLEQLISYRAISGGEPVATKVTGEDILNHLKRMDEAFKFIAANVYRVHEQVADVKEQYVGYLRLLHGDHVPDPFATKPKAATAVTPRKLSGPDPFALPSQSVLLGMAGSTPQTQPIPAAPTLGAPTTGLFGAAPMSFGSTAPSFLAPTTTTTSLFKPFSSTLSTGTTFGTQTNTSTANNAFRFSTPFNNSASGTLFGGTATTLGVNKPFGT